MLAKRRNYQRTQSPSCPHESAREALVLTVLHGSFEQGFGVRAAKRVADKPSPPTKVIFPVIQAPEVVQLAKNGDTKEQEHCYNNAELEMRFSIESSISLVSLETIFFEIFRSYYCMHVYSMSEQTLSSNTPVSGTLTPSALLSLWCSSFIIRSH